MRQVFRVSAAGATDVGKKRSHNEDFIGMFTPADEPTLRTSGSLYLVADGVGGAAYGERASRYAVQKVLFAYYHRGDLPPAERLVWAIQQASRDIHAYSQSEAVGQPVATTLVAAAVWGETLIVANVGDSRAYLLRDGVAEQITRDHNLMSELLREGVVSEEEARTAPARNRLTRSLGGSPTPQVDVFTRTLQPGDRVVLCSDGLTRYLSTEDLARMASEGQPQAVVQALVAFANRQGGADNISALLVEIGERMPLEALPAAPAEGLPSPPEPLEAPAAPGPSPAGKTTPLPGARRPWWRKTWLGLVVLFLVGCLVGMGAVALFRSRAVPTPAPGFSPPTVASSVPGPTLQPVATPQPSPTSTLAVASPTPAPTLTATPQPSAAPLLPGPYACIGEIGPHGAFYGLLVRVGLLQVAARDAFWAQLASRGRFREVLYTSQSSLPPPNEAVSLQIFQRIPVPAVSPAKDANAWVAFENQLRRFSPTTVVVLPAVSQAMCEAGLGWWQPFQSLPPWMRDLPPLTPEATPPG